MEILRRLACLAAVLAVVASSRAATLFSTGFEASEGYANGSTLTGGEGWSEQHALGDPDFTVTDATSFTGAQSLGFDTSTAFNQDFVWVPLGFNPDANSDKIIEGQVALGFTDSHGSGGELQNSWFGMYAFHNGQSNPFCDIQVEDDDYLYVDTEEGSHRMTHLDAGTWYQLKIRLDYNLNRMTAFLDGSPIYQSLFGGEVVSDFSLGEVPLGYNSVYFDNYSVQTLSSAPEPAPWIGLAIGCVCFVRRRRQ